MLGLSVRIRIASFYCAGVYLFILLKLCYLLHIYYFFSFITSLQLMERKN